MSSSSSSSSSKPGGEEAPVAPSLDDGALGLENLKQIMSEEGPIVDVVILSTDGSVLQEKTDMTPRKNNIGKRLGGSVTFIGQYHTIGVIIAKNLEKRGAENPHKLQVPFHKEVAKGDIALIKVGQDAAFMDFTKTEWEAFLKEDIDPSKYEDSEQKADVDPGENMVDEADIEEDEETIMREQLLAHICKEFEKMNNRQPSMDEIKEILKRLQENQSDDWGSDSENDEDFKPENEEDDSEDDSDEDGEEDGDAEMENVNPQKSSSSSSSKPTSSPVKRKEPEKPGVDNIMESSPAKKTKVDDVDKVD